MNTIDFIVENKVICICRRLYGEDLLHLAHALCDGGVKLMEVTFDQEDPDCAQKTAGAIQMLCAEMGDQMQIGAGTVLTCEQVKQAKNAGAKYIISPNTNQAVIEHTKKLGLVSIPGAMTPSEIVTAYNYGADFVKLFPAGYLGLSYLKDIVAPIGHIKLLATGGISEENFQQYLDKGVVGAGISGRLMDKALIARGEFDTIKDRAAEFMRIAGTVK